MAKPDSVLESSSSSAQFPELLLSVTAAGDHCPLALISCHIVHSNGTRRQTNMREPCESEGVMSSTTQQRAGFGPIPPAPFPNSPQWANSSFSYFKE